jgi:hypothetical protein
MVRPVSRLTDRGKAIDRRAETCYLYRWVERSRSVRRALLALVIASSAACSIALDGLSSSRTTATPEAGIESGISAAAEAGSEDAAVPSSLACPPNALVCEDFEKSDALDFWTVHGATTISDAQSASPSHSVTFAMEQGGTGPVAQGVFNDLSTSKLTVAFDVYAATPATTYVEVLKLPFGPAFNWDSVVVSVNDSGLSVGLDEYDGSGTAAESDFAVIVPADSFYGKGWVHVALDIDMSASPRRVTIDAGTSGVGRKTRSLATTHAPPTFVTMYLGFSYGDVTYRDVFLDNVVFAPTP